MKRRTKFTSQSGTSLIELIVVLVIISVLVTFAVAQFGSPKKNLERQNIVRELKVSLERARFDSVKRRAVTVNEKAKITIHNATSFSLSTDSNQNGIVEYNEARRVEFADSGINFVGANLAYPITVSFDRRGFITATNGIGAKITPNFTICKNCTASTVNAENSNTLSISPTGTVVLLASGKDIWLYENPEVTAVNTDSQINQKVTVNPAP
jgi:prepilin-type N-terminal cleavage/methylation domain-containing protein